MPGKYHLYALLSSAAMLAVATPCLATSIDLHLKPGQLSENPDQRDEDKLQSGLQLAMRNQLLRLAVDYHVQAQVDELGAIDNNSAQQRLGATIQSSRLDRLLGGKTRLQTNSVLKPGTDGYSHRLSPAFSRSLLDIATVDIKYGYLLSKASAHATEKQTQSYSLGLRGSLPGGLLTWSGAYTTANTFHRQEAPAVQLENFRFQSEYRVGPTMKLQLFRTIKQQTKLAASQQVTSAESRYGAGVTWRPSGRYSLDFKLDRRDQSLSGERELLSSGSVSWFPSTWLAVSLDYGDQLVEGERGILLSTRLEYDRF